VEVRFKIIVRMFLNTVEGFARLMDRINMDYGVRQIWEMMKDFMAGLSSQIMRFCDGQNGRNR